MYCSVYCISLDISTLVRPVLWILGVALGVVSNPPSRQFSVGFTGMFTDDQFATYDLSFCISMCTPNIMQNAEMMSVFLCSDSSVADTVMRSSIYAGFCVYISLPGSPVRSMLSFFTSGTDSATSRMSKNASHVVALRIAP